MITLRPLTPCRRLFTALLVLSGLLLTHHASAQNNQSEATLEPLLDVSYGPAERHRFDFYPAPQHSASPCPVVIYFHGGGFRSGDKSRLSKVLTTKLHARGISVVAANYRFFATDPLPAPMHDGARVVQFLRAHADTFRIDPKRIAVTGTSAGAGISLWINYHDDLADPNAQDPVARQSSRISGAYVKDAQISYDPQVWKELGLDRLTRRRSFNELYGYPDTSPITPALQNLMNECAPMTHISPDDPPVRADYRVDLSINDNTSPTSLLHHPSHGLRLLKLCTQSDIPCELYYANGPSPDETADAYLARILGME